MTQLVTAAPKVVGHVTFSSSTNFKMEYQLRLRLAKCHLVFTKKCCRILGSFIIIEVLKEQLISMHDRMDGLMAHTQHMTPHPLPW